MKTNSLSQKRIKDLLLYDCKTGKFKWAISRKGVSKGSIAGCLAKSGYVLITIDYKTYLGHRLAWFYMFGSFPYNEIDHINNDRSDNRLCNLREATKSQNGMNKPISDKNTSGYKGVCWNKSNFKWMASCRANGKQNFIGYYDNPKEASIAYKEFAKNNHKEFFNNKGV